MLPKVTSSIPDTTGVSHTASFFFFFFWSFLGPHPQHMEVPRLGVESELQLPTYATVTTPDPS